MSPVYREKEPSIKELISTDHEQLAYDYLALHRYLSVKIHETRILEKKIEKLKADLKKVRVQRNEYSRTVRVLHSELEKVYPLFKID